ncbi:virulence factor TspB C-terminal domain-related protein [Vibrio litoralis]|uniref:virulence factor TspB C-terminal domain-related protein n=1 Tax=Vibrio litoralis TaxID=335972 RepID=UPI0004066488|nr:virulence factor TspB C-terminal domain-related protein [Vibrio litoralis]
MKWILFFLFSIQGFVSFVSQAEIVDKLNGVLCEDYPTGQVLGTALDSDECKQFAESSSSYPLCETNYGDSFFIVRTGSGFSCTPNNSNHYLLVKIDFSKVCLSPHSFETQNGQCSDEIADTIPNEPLPEKQENGCYPSGTIIDNVYGPSSIKNKSSCFSDSCSATIRPSDSVTVCTVDENGIDNCQFNLVSSGQSCEFNASNPQWVDDLPLENSGEYTPSNDLSGGGIDSGSLDGSGNPVSGAESTNLYEQQITNENLKRLIDDQATLLTDINKSLNHSIDYDQVKTGYLKQISENTKNISGGGGGGSSSGDGGDWSGSGDSITSDSCESFACSSHPVICQLAKEDWLKRCEVDDFLSSGGDGSQIADGLQNFIDENPNELLEAGSLDVSNVMNKYTKGEGLSTSATCPAPKSVNAGIATFEIDYTPFCDMAVIIKALIIIFSSVTSILLISKYM